MSTFKWPEEFITVAWSELGRDIWESWTDLLAEDTGMKIRFDGTLDTRYDLALTGTTKAAQILAGERRSEKRGAAPFPMRMVWPQSRTNSGYFVRGDSPIRTVYDIKPGYRVVDMRSYVASQNILNGLLAWAGIKDIENDINWVPARNAKEKTQLVVDGAADLAFGVPGSPSVMEAEKNPHGLHWLDCNWEADPEGAKRFLAIDPLISFGVIQSGVPSAIGVWGTSGTSSYCTDAATSNDLIYNLVRWLDENYNRFKDAHPWNLTCRRDILLDELSHTFIPLHEGVRRYLDEVGDWTPALEKRQQANLALLEKHLELDAKATATAKKKGLKITDDNPEWRKLLADMRRKDGVPDFRIFVGLDD